MVAALRISATNSDTVAPRRWLLWERHIDRRAYEISPINPVTLAWWAGWQAWRFLRYRMAYPTVWLLMDMHLLADYPEGEAWQWRHLRTFSMKRGTIRERNNREWEAAARHYDRRLARVTESLEARIERARLDGRREGMAFVVESLASGGTPDEQAMRDFLHTTEPREVPA